MTTVQPHEFGGLTPPERIMGAECEYSIHVRDLGPEAYENPIESGFIKDWYMRRIFSPETLQAHFRNTPTALQRQFVDKPRVSLANGARAYLDVGDHPEYCTPETRSVGDVVAADLAGIRTMQGFARATQEIFRPDGTGRNVDLFELYRRTGYRHLPDKPTAGYHDNYMLPGEVANSETCINLIGAHIATDLWGWSGAVGEEGYELSQKSSGIGSGVQFDLKNIVREGAKPLAALINDGDVVAYDPSWRRLEVRAADAPLSPWANAMRYGTTSLVLRLAEHPDLLDEQLRTFAIDNPILMLKQANLDLTLQATVPTSSGNLSALDVQELFAGASGKLAEQVQLPEHELWTIQQWLQACDDMRALAGQRPDSADFSMLADRSEWAARYTFLQQKLGGAALTTANAKSVMVDLLWDRIHPAGLGLAYWKKQVAGTNDVFMQHVLTRANRLEWEAPENTRAAARSQLIGSQALHDVQAEWHVVRASPTPGGKLLNHWLTDPYTAVLPVPTTSGAVA